MKEEFFETCSTIYHTTSGDIEIPDPEIKATYKSHIAPLWLVFPNNIINTKHIIEMHPEYSQKEIIFLTRDKKQLIVPVTDIEMTWSALQKVFTEGVSDDQ